MDAEGRGYLRPAQVADELSTVYELLRSRGLPAVRVRGQWRIPADRFRRWLEDPPPRREADVLTLHRR